MSPGALIGGLGRRLSWLSEKLVPDPFIIAIILTLVAFAGGVVFFEVEPGQTVGLFSRVEAVLGGWSGSFYTLKLMRFAFQMCIVLVTGHALALSPPVQKAVLVLARLPKTTASAAVLVAFVALVSGVIHWGLGAVVGAFLAREIGRLAARENRPLHYPILGAAAYMGFLVWHGGLSASAPLKVAESDHFLVEKIGVIPVANTLGLTSNLVITGVMFIAVPLIFWLMAPRDSAAFIPYPQGGEGRVDPVEQKGREGFAGALENSRLLSSTIALIGLAWLCLSMARGSAGLNLDTVNLLFLFAGILLQPSPIQYVRAVADGARACGGIILQFPFYFGILGVLQASGLAARFAALMVGVANKSTFLLLTFLSAGLVNLFVPSGGGQWAVQGEILVEACQGMGLGINQTIMAFAYGDQLTNMLQPFWALPLLAITGLEARQIVGYTATVMVLVAPLYLVLLFLFSS